MKADLVIIDLDDVAHQPLNSVARQLVFSETGRGVETTIVDGRTFRRDFANIAEPTSSRSLICSPPTNG